jgi:hypothetical protein
MSFTGSIHSWKCSRSVLLEVHAVLDRYLRVRSVLYLIHQGSRVLRHVYVPCQRRQSQGRRAIRHLAGDPEGNGICLKIPPGNWGGLRRGAPLLRIWLPTETHEPTTKSAKQTIFLSHVHPKRQSLSRLPSPVPASGPGCSTTFVHVPGSWYGHHALPSPLHIASLRLEKNMPRRSTMS